MARNLGMVTAYAYAVAGGYTGTEAEFEELLGNIADDLSQIENLSVTVTTLTPGSSATASYSNGVLALGIPRGNTGATGNGISAIIKTGTSGLVDTYTVTYTNGQTMTYTVTNGAKGDTGNGIASIALTSTSGAVKTYTVTFTDGSTFTFDVTDGEVTNASLAEALEDFSANGTVANAEQLTTDIRANDQTPYLFRTAGGSVDIGDREYINGIVGGTVAFNQLAKALSSSNWANESGVSSSFSDGVATITNSSATNRGIYTLTSFVSEHKYFISAELSPTEAKTYIIGRSSVGVYTDKALSANSGFVKLEKICKATSTTDTNVYIYGSGGEYSNLKAKNFMLIDLTLLFGSTIADYIYSLEQATAGAGVAWFKSLFPKPYYAYNAGELMSVKGLVSHDMVGFNAWDEEWEVGNLDGSGLPVPSNNNIRSKNFTPVISGAVYYMEFSDSNGEKMYIAGYDAEKNFVSYIPNASGINSAGQVAIPDNVSYIKINMGSLYGTTYNHDICINLSWDGSRNGEYEPYQKWSYPLDSDLELRGIPKIENGNLYYDGDIYESDGTVTRKYGIVDLGTLNWGEYGSTDSVTQYYTIGLDALAKPFGNVISDVGCYSQPIVANTIYISQPTGMFYVRTAKDVYASLAAFKTAMSGHYLVYELATPTTETADPYTSPQIVSDFGTEEYVIDDDVFAIPVGHNTDYPVDLKAKLEMAPNSPGQGNGDYIVRQTNGVNEYVPLVIEEVLPQTPSSNGTYSLTLTVANGEATLSWT